MCWLKLKNRTYFLRLAFQFKFNTVHFRYKRLIHVTLHPFSSLSYDRSKASSKASSPHSLIQSFFLQKRVSSPFLNTLRTGSFKLFKRPFPGFLTILTL